MIIIKLILIIFKSGVSILSHPRGPQIFGSLMESCMLRKGTRVGYDTEIPVQTSL